MILSLKHQGLRHWVAKTKGKEIFGEDTIPSKLCCVP